MHPVGFEFTTSYSNLFLQEEEIPFELELIGHPREGLTITFMKIKIASLSFLQHHRKNNQPSTLGLRI
jgi:hypothetical protein